MVKTKGMNKCKNEELGYMCKTHVMQQEVRI